MALLGEAEVAERAAREVTRLQKSANRILAEAARADGKFDVFLSHSSKESESILLGIKGMFEDRGLSVYVDRYSDPQLDPEKVTPATAQLLRSRMMNCGALIYVHSSNSTHSRWMPWELGYFDGLKGRVGIIPVLPSPRSGRFVGEEYLGLYPYVDYVAPSTSSDKTFWINGAAQHYAQFVNWVRGKEEITQR